MEEHNTKALNDALGGKLEIPLKSDGTEFKVSHIKGDQKDVACEVFAKIKEWLEFNSNDNDDKFEPRRTCSGCGGAHRDRDGWCR